MAQLMKFEKLHRLTLTTKGKSVAKHPALRSGVVEVVKSNAFEEVQEDQIGAEEKDWYAEFDAFVGAQELPQGVESWEEAFALADTEKESAQRKNYPDSAGPFAGPHNSFPITSQHHVYAAARLLGHAQNPAQVKANIIRIAHSKGYSLPKSWQTKKKVSSLELTDEQAQVLTNLADLLGSGEAQKARTPAPTTHAHAHAHLSVHGYSYDHNHDHQHTPDHMAAHDTHETAHAHTHLGLVQKASMDEAELKAELDGLHNKVQTVETLAQTLQEAITKLTEKESALDAALAKLDEAAAKQAELAEKVSSLETAAVRRPMTLAPETGEKAKITPNMKFDDAFAAVMHSGN